ncbi:MAG: efflux RND transporter periplasmic adaptor subunit, partial [Proteobacteria bacterium]|nr:efflux RND transporter periplasmic adaptor subunit [Pseudomonadota bacterium]
MPPPAVTVVTLDAGPVTLTRELPGRTNPFLVAEVRPQVSGVIKEQLFTEGGEVEAGQPLYQLDDAAYRAEFNSARAQLARAEATLHSARLTAERTAELVSTGAVSTQQNDNAVAALRQAEADVAVAEAAVASARVVLDYARIVSPIDGRIGRSTVTKGALVTAGSTIAEKPTDSKGSVMVAGLATFTPITVGIDRGSLSDPMLAPKKAVQVVVPRPGVPAVVEIG